MLVFRWVAFSFAIVALLVSLWHAFFGRKDRNRELATAIVCSLAAAAIWAAFGAPWKPPSNERLASPAPQMLPPLSTKTTETPSSGTTGVDSALQNREERQPDDVSATRQPQIVTQVDSLRPLSKANPSSVAGYATCSEGNTGHFGFANTKTTTRFTVVVYLRQGSDSNRTITVPPRDTQFVYDFPAGAHSYMVTYRAQVPIMPFPPGAPTMERDVIYQQGQVYVEQCKSKILELK